MSLLKKQEMVDIKIAMLKRHRQPYPRTCGALLLTEEACDKVLDECDKAISNFTCNA